MNIHIITSFCISHISSRIEAKLFTVSMNPNNFDTPVFTVLIQLKENKGNTIQIVMRYSLPSCNVFDSKVDLGKT